MCMLARVLVPGEPGRKLAGGPQVRPDVPNRLSGLRFFPSLVSVKGDTRLGRPV